MVFLNEVKLIQGGMGVYVSNWRLAKTVALEKPGITAGTVSGTGLDLVYVRTLQLGDPGGHIRRAFTALDSQFGVTIGQKIFERYYIPGGKAPEARFRNPPKQTVHTQDGSTRIPPSKAQEGPVELIPGDDMVELLIAAGFAEVWLAKEGHAGKIFINFLKKIELPLIYTMYGAMLASVDGVVVGAGNPDGLPEICSRLANHAPVSADLQVLYRESGETFNVQFDPPDVANGSFVKEPLPRPAFLAIVSLENLVVALAQSPNGAPDGFIIEHHSAGGHNAGPQGPLKKDEKKQPIYGPEDEPDLQTIRRLGIPFWLAGGYDSREKMEEALQAGATGIQTGTVFALAEESGMKPEIRAAILKELKNGQAAGDLVHTTLFSPTGFPFKVVQLEGTVAEEAVYADRPRICDIGILEQRVLGKPDTDGMRQLYQRCSAAPIDGFIKKRGLLFNTQDRRCLCNGLIACVGLGQVYQRNGNIYEEPAIVTLGRNLSGARKLSRQGQTHYWVKDVVQDILGDL